MTDRLDPSPVPGPLPAADAGSGGPEAPDRGGGGTVAWSPAGEPPPGVAGSAAGGPPAAASPTPDAAEPPPAPPPDSRLPVAAVVADRFRIVRFIGRGAMGDVYEAEDLELGERVALKTVRSDIAHLDVAIERFRREIQLARKVTHPNVCRIFDVFRHRPEGSAGQRDELVFFSMELLPGETLEQRLRRDGKLPPAEALPIVRQVADGLTAAHRAGVIHRDFKPGNVMLVPGDGEPRAVVTDFGLARTYGAGDSLTVHGHILGTPSYMAPEQVAGGEVTAASDVYALGCVLYEMVTGVPPFLGENSFSIAFKRLNEDPCPPHLRAPGLDPAWDAAILRCLARAPADRFAQACDVAVALTGEAGAPASRRRPRPSRRALAAGAALVLLAALAWAGARWLRPARPGAAVGGAAGRLATLFRGPEELYADGVKLLGKLDAPRARELFDKAIAARRDYWLAHSGLAVAQADLGHDDRAAQEAKLAFDHAAALPRDERLLVTARYWQVARSPDKAAESYRQLQSLHPGDIESGLGLVQALVDAGRGSDALQAVERLRRQPGAAAAGPRLDLATAEAEKSLSDFPRQAQAARQAREQAERAGDDLLAARALRLEGAALARQGNLEAALGAYKKAEAIYAGTADQRSLAQLLSATAKVLVYQGHLELARDKAREALDSFKEVGDLRGQSQQLDLLAAIEGEQGNLAGAQSRFAALIETYRRLGDRPSEAQATGNLGFALQLQGKLDEAAKRYQQALALDRQLQNRGDEALQLYRLAGVSFNQLDLGKAEAYLASSLSLATASDAANGIIDALELQAEMAIARGDLAGARAKCEEALTRGRGAGDKMRMAGSQLALAKLELEKGHPSPAEAYARKALDQFRGEHQDDAAAEADAVLVSALLAERSLAEAQDVMAQADRLAAKSLDPEVKISVALANARLAAAAARPAEALRTLDAALALARTAGLGPLGLEARLALGELASERGDRKRAAQDLAALADEARHHGFNLIADHAARARAAAAAG